MRLRFRDGTEDIVDLVVGADGIRSVVRQHVFPSHSIQYTGMFVLFLLRARNINAEGRRTGTTI